MSATIGGTITSTYDLTDPTTQNPLTIASTGRVAVAARQNPAAIVGSSAYAWTIANFGTVESVGQLGGFGISFASGGLVINGSTDNTAALINSNAAEQSVGVRADAGTVINYGSIHSYSAPAYPRGFGGGFGIDIVAGPGTVSNHGLIDAKGSTEGRGIDLERGGLVINGSKGHSGAVINSRAGYVSYAVQIRGADSAGTVINYGFIRSSVSSGVACGCYYPVSVGVQIAAATGTVLNYGLISAPRGGGVAVNNGIVVNGGGGFTHAQIVGSVGCGDGTVVNYGTISGRGSFGGVRLFNGLVANYGMIASSGRGSYGVLLDGAAEVTNTGTIVGATGVGIGFGNTAANTIVNFGTIVGTSGIAVRLGAGDDLLVIEPGSVLQGAVSGFHPGDAFDLPGLAFAPGGSAILGPSNVLQVSESTDSVTIALDPNQSFAGEQFQLADDGAGGTSITESLGSNPANGVAAAAMGFTFADIAAASPTPGTAATADPGSPAPAAAGGSLLTATGSVLTAAAYPSFQVRPSG